MPERRRIVYAAPVAARELDVEAERREFEAYVASCQSPFIAGEEWSSLEIKKAWLVWLAARSAAQGTQPESAPVSTEQAGDAWISVEDRLPEDKQVVAFVVDTQDWERFKYLHGRVLGGQYSESEGHFSVPGLSLFASHWMPLPAAPSPNNSPVGGKDKA